MAAVLITGYRVTEASAHSRFLINVVCQGSFLLLSWN